VLNKAELVAKVAEKAGLTKKDSERAVSAVFGCIEEALARGEKVSLVGFGTFEVRARRGREAKNPRTGETVWVPAAWVPALKASKALKEKVKAAKPTPEPER
jgi:DNA-binding protein HU-beta